MEKKIRNLREDNEFESNTTQGNAINRHNEKYLILNAGNLSQALPISLLFAVFFDVSADYLLGLDEHLQHQKNNVTLAIFYVI